MPDVIKSVGTAGRDYADLNLFKADLNNTVYPDPDTHVIAQLYNDAPIDHSSWIQFASGTGTNIVKITIESAPGERHIGIENSGARIRYTGPVRGNPFLEFSFTTAHPEVVCQDFEINQGHSDNKHLGGCTGVTPFTGHNSLITIRRMLLYNFGSVFVSAVAPSGVLVSVPSQAGRPPVYILRNFIFKGISATSNDACGIGIIAGGASHRAVLCWGNSIYDVQNTSSGNAYGIHSVHANTSCEFKNNVVGGISGTAIADDYDIAAGDVATNASEDATAPDPIVGNPIVPSNEFEQLTGNYNLHLKSGAECIDAGTNLGTTQEVNIDIDLEPVSGTWDVGGDEIAATGIDLVINNSEHTHQASSPVLTTQDVLEIDNAFHTQIALSPGLLTEDTLIIDPATHVHEASQIDLAGGDSLITDNAEHGHDATSPTLLTTDLLLVQASTHGHNATSPQLVEEDVLVIENAFHTHEATSIDLASGIGFDPDNAFHGHEASSPIVTEDDILIIQNAFHTHEASTPVLTTDDSLTVDPSAHGHEASQIDLNTFELLLVQGATHGHNATSPQLAVSDILNADPAFHNIESSSPVLLTEDNLNIDPAFHGHIASSPFIQLVTGIRDEFIWTDIQIVNQVAFDDVDISPEVDL